MIDVSNPALPVELGALNTPGYASGVEVVGGLAYVADSWSVSVIDFGPEYRTGIAVEIDIKPRSGINPIDTRSRGVVPVAILGSTTFDVADVDRTTLAFGPEGATPVRRRAGRISDVNRDGFMDLLSLYRIRETGIAIGDTEACVTGETLDGTALEGCDVVATRPPGRCGTGFSLVFLVPPLIWMRQRRRCRDA